MSEPIEIRADADMDGMRLDRALASALPELSRTRLKTLIQTGEVRVNGRTLEDPSHRVNCDDALSVNVPPPQPAAPQPQDIPLSVLFEDDAIIVIDKPSGLAVHPGAGRPDGTLVNALLHHCGDSLAGIGGVERPGIVHRLDRETSGVMVVAKTDRAHRDLSKQFADHGKTRGLLRAYRCWVWGAPAPPAGTIDRPLARDPRNPIRMAVREGGRHAVTHFRTEAVYGPTEKPLVSRLECRLETGRTHQIRVHLASINHPLLGDETYASGYATKSTLLEDDAKDALIALGRQALHAYLLVIEHPVTGDLLHFESENPADLARLDASLATM